MYARRGIYAKIKIKKGDVFTVKNIIPLRPAFNTIKVEKWDKIIGRKANKNYNPGEALRE
jgi:sialic acid synthase SpsE